MLWWYGAFAHVRGNIGHEVSLFRRVYKRSIFEDLTGLCKVSLKKCQFQTIFARNFKLNLWKFSEWLYLKICALQIVQKKVLGDTGQLHLPNRTTNITGQYPE